MGELFPQKGLKIEVPSIEQIPGRLEALDDILARIALSIDTADGFTQVDELEQVRAEVIIDRNSIARRLGPIATERSTFGPDDYAIDLIEQLERV